MNWTADQKATVKQLWSDGLSATQIAAEIGCGCTRNAAIGIVHRMKIHEASPNSNLRAHAEGLGHPPRPRSKNPNRGPAAFKGGAPMVPQPEPLPEPVMSDLDIPFEQRKSFLDLTDATCRWPVGDVGTEGFFFCGGRSVEGFPYCISHVRRGYAGFGSHSQRRPFRDAA